MIKAHFYLFVLYISLSIVSFVIAVSFEKLTVLTAPLGRPNIASGHPAVNRSIVQGLKELGINFNYNPYTLEEVGDVVYVPAHSTALRQAIEWRHSGRIKKLLAGPNLFIRANEENSLLASPEIDLCIVPCEWVKIAYEEDEPRLKGHIAIWYAGINATLWVPLCPKRVTRNVVVYCKTDATLWRGVSKLLVAHGWNPIYIQYGSYNKETFKQMLACSSFAIFISRSESQGLALAECWAMDVPTVVWDPGILQAHNRTYSVVSAAPYLTSFTGCTWKTLHDLDIILRTKIIPLLRLQPRGWLLEHMTDRVAAQHLIDLIDSIPLP